MFNISSQRVLSLVRKRVLPHTLAVLALVTFALTPLAWLGLALVVITLGMTVWTYRMPGLGKSVASQVMLAAAGLVGFGRATRGDLIEARVGLGLVVAGFVLLGIVVNEATLTRVTPRRVRTAHLPGMAGRRLLDPNFVFVVEVAA